MVYIVVAYSYSCTPGSTSRSEICCINYVIVLDFYWVMIINRNKTNTGLLGKTQH